MDEKYKILYEELVESKKKKEEATKKVIEDLKKIKIMISKKNRSSTNSTHILCFLGKRS